jgi:hypothetical protein
MPTQAPPDIPSKVPPDVADYLRRLSTWAYQEIDRKISKNEATPGVLFSASDEKPPKHIFLLTVDHAGATHVTPVSLGGSNPP